MSDPSVNIFEALRRMGGKIPFRFPMVDQLVPVVTMYDVSRLVSAPVEARGLAGASRTILAPGGAFVFELLSLASGGMFVEFLSLESSIPSSGLGFWSFKIQSTTGGAASNVPVVDVGGTATASQVLVDELVWQAGLAASAARLTTTIQFQARPRFFVPAGSRLVLQSPLSAVGDFHAVSISWAELPASFEEP